MREWWSSSRIMLAGLLAMLLLLAYELKQGHDSVLALTRTTAENMAQALDGQVQGTLRRLESNLRNVAGQVPVQALRQDQAGRYRAQIERLLKPYLDEFPEMMSMSIWDGQGRGLYGTAVSQGPRPSIAGRPAFQSLRDTPDRPIAYTDSIHNSYTGLRTLGVYLPVRDEGGRLLGVVSGTLDLANLERVFSSLNLSKGSVIFIRDTQTHRLLIRYPALEGDYNKPVRNAIQQRIDAGELSGSDRFQAVTDGRKRVYGFRRFDRHPFYIVVGLDEEAAMASWTVQGKFVVGGVLGLLLVIGITLVRLRQQERLRLAAQREGERIYRIFTEAIENISVGFTIFDTEDRLVICNDAYRNMYFENSDIVRVGATFAEMARAKAERGLYINALGRVDQWVDERVRAHQRADGAPTEYLLSSGHWVLVIEQRTPSGYIVSNRIDITDRKRLEGRLEQLATIDGLTGLPNRMCFMGRMTDELRRVERQTTQQASVLMIDIDHFKSINDTHGHAGGDQALKHFAAIVSGQLRSIDVCGRMGGEEFAILLPGATAEMAEVTAERLRESIEVTPLQFHGHTIRLTASIGVTVLRATDKTPDEALHRADHALYQAKHGGRNRVRVA